MESIAGGFYPPVVWRDGEKKLWNPVRRKTFKNRPEERVRLRIIEFLLAAGWSGSRISTEESVGRPTDPDLRTDIVCYDRQFTPKLLIECKAEYVPVTEKTAEQTARYNRSINAPWLLMTNGVRDFWYRIDSDRRKADRLHRLPELLDHPATDGNRNFEYWENRGFAGEKAGSDLRGWLTALNSRLWPSGKSPAVRFLEFNSVSVDLELSHYYRIIRLDGERRLAVTVLNTSRGDSRLVAVLNVGSANRSLTDINLDLLFGEKAANTFVYSAGGVESTDIRSWWNPPARPVQTASAESIAGGVLRMLENVTG